MLEKTDLYEINMQNEEKMDAGIALSYPENGGLGGINLKALKENGMVNTSPCNH
jgi:hypothetical protein